MNLPSQACISFRGGESHGLCGYTVEPDASSASYFLAAAAISGGTVGVKGLTTKSIQGDVRFLDILEIWDLQRLSRT